MCTCGCTAQLVVRGCCTQRSRIPGEQGKQSHKGSCRTPVALLLRMGGTNSPARRLGLCGGSAMYLHCAIRHLRLARSVDIAQCTALGQAPSFLLSSTSGHAADVGQHETRCQDIVPSLIKTRFYTLDLDTSDMTRPPCVEQRCAMLSSHGVGWKQWRCPIQTRVHAESTKPITFEILHGQLPTTYACLCYIQNHRLGT